MIRAGWVTREEASLLAEGPAAPEVLSEAVVGVSRLPLSLIPNARFNGEEILIPMVTEEASIVAGASRVAGLLRGGRGIIAQGGGRRLSAQVFLEGPDAGPWLEAHRSALISRLDQEHPRLVAAGGGVDELRLRISDRRQILEVLARVADAMGAHAVDRMAESLARAWEQAGGRTLAAIVSNWPEGPFATAEAQVPVESLARAGRSGSEVAEGIVRLSDWAREDPRRGITHLKGTMNGVLGVLAAFRQDLRAADAAAQAAVWCGVGDAAPATWEIHGDSLCGRMCLPVPCGIAGRAMEEPTLDLLRRLAGITSGRDLEAVALGTGLITNLAALQVLVTEGIVSGHGRLHDASGQVEVP